MKKVLMISCDGLGNGGVQHVMMNIVRNLSNKFNFDMLLFTKEVRYFDAEFSKYGNIFRITKYEGPSLFRKKIDYYIRFFRIYNGVKKILKNNGPYNVIHCHNLFEAAPCLMAAKECEVPIRISHCHSSPNSSHFLAEFYRFIYRKIINSCATYKLGCSQLATDYLFGKNKGISVPNAIDLHKFDLSRYPIHKIKHSFIHVGSFGLTKNQSFILDVFKIIQKQWQDATLKMIGNKNEEYEKLLYKKITDLNLKNVQLLPHDSNIPNLFSQSEYMIFPSLFEGFPLVLLEAQAMNVKCFVSNVITMEANIGLCKYISLNKPEEYWAKEIFKSEKEPINKIDLNNISLSNYITKINQIYEGKQ